MSATPYFGRAWTVTISPAELSDTPSVASSLTDSFGNTLPGAPAYRGADSNTPTLTISSSTWDSEPLRVTFEIEQVAMAVYWHAEISIYNCQPAMAKKISKGDTITVSAGYDRPGQGLIFKGTVFQPLWERVSDTDYRLALHCLVGLLQDETGQVNTVIPANTTPYDAVTLVAGQTKPATRIEYLDESLKSGARLPRAESFSGCAMQYFVGVAANARLDCWMSYNGLNIRSLAPTKSTPDVIYTPPYVGTSSDPAKTKPILLGTPVQTERGITWRTLLDPYIHLGALCKIEQVLIERLPLAIGQLQSPLDKDGMYVVAGFRHVGGTRDDEWFTEVTGVTRQFPALFAQQSF